MKTEILVIVKHTGGRMMPGYVIIGFPEGHRWGRQEICPDDARWKIFSIEGLNPKIAFDLRQESWNRRAQYRLELEKLPTEIKNKLGNPYDREKIEISADLLVAAIVERVA